MPAEGLLVRNIQFSGALKIIISLEFNGLGPFSTVPSGSNLCELKKKFGFLRICSEKMTQKRPGMRFFFTDD